MTSDDPGSTDLSDTSHSKSYGWHLKKGWAPNTFLKIMLSVVLA